jgi:multiple sugar transport system permease protein
MSWVVLLCWAAFALAPMIWLLLAVTKSEIQLSTDAPFSFGSFTNLATSWRKLYEFQGGIILRWIGNTLILTGGGIVLTVLVTIPAAYALGTIRFAGRKPLLVVSLSLMLLPASSLVLPLFLEMSLLGLLGSRLSVILPLSVFPFGLYVAFIFYSTAVSRELYDAARVDGCTEWKVFLRIAVPLSRPIIVLVAFFAFIRNWNDFVLPLLLLNNDTYPLPVGLAFLASSTPMLSAANPIGGVDVPTLLLATLLTMAPVVAAILFAQRSVIRGAGALGGALRG